MAVTQNMKLKNIKMNTVYWESSNFTHPTRPKTRLTHGHYVKKSPMCNTCTIVNTKKMKIKNMLLKTNIHSILKIY